METIIAWLVSINAPALAILFAFAVGVLGPKCNEWTRGGRELRQKDLELSINFIESLGDSVYPDVKAALVERIEAAEFKRATGAMFRNSHQRKLVSVFYKRSSDRISWRQIANAESNFKFSDDVVSADRPRSKRCFHYFSCVALLAMTSLWLWLCYEMHQVGWSPTDWFVWIAFAVGPLGLCLYTYHGPISWWWQYKVEIAAHEFRKPTQSEDRDRDPAERKPRRQHIRPERVRTG